MPSCSASQRNVTSHIADMVAFTAAMVGISEDVKTAMAAMDASRNGIALFVANMNSSHLY
jgi:hypothetical protein